MNSEAAKRSIENRAPVGEAVVDIRSVPGRPSTFVPITVADGVRSSAGRSGAKIAIADEHRGITFRNLVSRMDRFSSATIAGLGLEQGHHVAILSPNSLEYFEAVLGLAQVGVAPVHISPNTTVGEIEKVCDHAAVRAIFVHPSLVDLVHDADLPGVDAIVPLGGEKYEEWLQLSQPTRPAVVVEEWDPFCLFYTAGTTGAPKGVVLSHRSRVGNYFGMASEYGCFGPDDHALAVAPMSHGAGLTFSLAPVFFGGTTTIHRKFDAEHLIADLARLPVTNVFLVPTHFNRIFELPATLLAPRPSALTRIISNAAPLPYSMKERIVAHFGPGILFECYGSTEASIVSNLRPSEQLTRPGSVGLPFPCTEVSLRDDSGAEVSDGLVGELFSRSPYLFNGYWRVPFAETPGLDGEWFSSGDLAQRDEDGYLYIVGRKDDSIITGGINVYPREIEEALLAHSDVAEVVVYGVPDERWGEAVYASVRLHQTRSVSPQELISFAKQSLSAYKTPKFVEIVDDLPRNASGKILRRVLRAKFAAPSEQTDV